MSSDSDDYYVPDYLIRVGEVVWVIRDEWLEKARECSFEYEDSVSRDRVMVDFLYSGGKYALCKFFEWSGLEIEGYPIVKRVGGGWDSDMESLLQANGYPSVEMEDFQDYFEMAKKRGVVEW